MFKFKTKLFFLSFSLLSVISNAQLTTSTALTTNQLVQNVLLGLGITASNITYNGAPVAIGSFNGSNSNIGFASGVLMTSGDVANAVGPNDEDGTAALHGLPGDIDLDSIMAPTLSFDASVLEFDFIATSDTLNFRYVFGSDEYMEWVSGIPGDINDAFGFFLSGPGITGPFSNNSKNIAIIPGTTLPVSMYNLNLNSNSTYYFDNGNGAGSGTAPDGLTVQYDGFTTPLTATAQLQCGQQYHIKIAIGDGGDDFIDSGVFLEAGSFAVNTGYVEAFTTTESQGIPSSILYEGCGDACIYFVRHSPNIALSETYTVNYSGSASNNMDYNLPSSITFAPNQDTLPICFSPEFDSQIEGNETLQIQIIQQNPCASDAHIDFTIAECPISIPNVISSDGNTTNDKLVIHGAEDDPNSTLEIFNRWGNRLYKTKGYKNDWAGEKQSAGTYYYIFTTGDSRIFAGFFQLVR